MLEGCHHLTIRAAFDQIEDNGTGELYSEAVRRTLPKLLPAEFLTELGRKDLTQEARQQLFNEKLPYVYCSAAQPIPFNKSFFVLSRYRSNSFKFFFEMVSRWLIPGKRLNVVLINACDFRITELGADIYTVCEVIIRVESEKELADIHRNLPIIQSEIKLGTASAYYARRILEVKGLSADEKIAQIQEHIAYLVKRLPNSFENDVFTEIQHLMVTCSDAFKEERTVLHLSRMVSTNYLFRRQLREALREAPNKRHLLLKVMRAKPRRVLGIAVGVNFLRDKEVFEERHIIKALKNHMPSVRPIEGSFVFNRRVMDRLGTLYLEIEKSDQSAFTTEEIGRLRRDLPDDLKGRIEYPMHPLFNPRNEEEIMRNMLALTNQIKYVRDIPQVFISFDEQSYAHLFFTVILVRVLKAKDLSIEEMFRQSQSPFEYIPDKCRLVGKLRKKHLKEATVFRMKLSKEEFLRLDHSINLCEARQAVLNHIVSVLGEIRDYNGGMISKQADLLNALRSSLEETVPVDSFLLDNFFYSLTPVIMRSVMEPMALKKLYLMILAAFEKGLLPADPYDVVFTEDVEFLYATVLSDDPHIGDRLRDAISSLNVAATSLTTSHVVMFDFTCVGYVFRSDSAERREAFRQVVQRAIWQELDQTRVCQ